MQKRIPVKLPIANILNTASRSVAVTAIAGYQKFISPHKGFSCAHRVLYGCESCSQYFKRVIAEDGILTAIANAKGRFQECREANETLKKRRTKCRANYYATRQNATTMAIESGDLDNSENNDPPEGAENQADKKKLGGSQWGKNKRSQANANQVDGNSNRNNNCDNYMDCADCADGLDALACGNLNCPDLGRSDLNCDNADCLSGLDCSGCGDCSGADCSGADCGSCG